jgi:hypothetical protein
MANSKKKTHYTPERAQAVQRQLLEDSVYDRAALMRRYDKQSGAVSIKGVGEVYSDLLREAMNEWTRDEWNERFPHVPWYDEQPSSDPTAPQAAHNADAQAEGGTVFENADTNPALRPDFNANEPRKSPQERSEHAEQGSKLLAPPQEQVDAQAERIAAEAEEKAQAAKTIGGLLSPRVLEVARAVVRERQRGKPNDALETRLLQLTVNSPLHDAAIEQATAQLEQGIGAQGESYLGESSEPAPAAAPASEPAEEGS